MRPPLLLAIPVSRPISSAAFVLYAFALALALGVGSAYWVQQGPYPFGGVTIGPWKAWPRVGSRQADPYARAIVTRRGDVPLAIGEGLALTATIDAAGQRLDSACSYRIGAVTPQARLWTLALYDESGALVSTELGRRGLTSAEILRDADGKFAIALSRRASPGNWLQLPQAGAFSVILRLYDTPAAVGSAALEAAALPTIERVECGA